MKIDHEIKPKLSKRKGKPIYSRHVWIFNLLKILVNAGK